MLLKTLTTDFTERTRMNTDKNNSEDLCFYCVFLVNALKNIHHGFHGKNTDEHG